MPGLHWQLPPPLDVMLHGSITIDRKHYVYNVKTDSQQDFEDL